MTSLAYISGTRTSIAENSKANSYLTMQIQQNLTKNDSRRVLGKEENFMLRHYSLLKPAKSGHAVGLFLCQLSNDKEHGQV